MKNLAFAATLLALLNACAASDESGLNPNLMTDEEIIAYNRTQDRIWDHIVCVRHSSIRSRIPKRDCGTMRQINRRMAASSDQLDIISFGTPAIWQ